MIGQTIGTYRIEQKVGEGGMGAVYRGRDLMLEREVAIKALRPELARQPELVARFRSEAVTLARLNHSHIATLYNFLRHGSDYFMVMEFVRGRTLEEIIRQTGAIETECAVRLFCQALEGIAHAHALGVIHRDIKPANLMLTEGDQIKVMDFGIARVLGTARQTKTGRLIGTLEYMSPEQMRGLETDARSDLYSLGILLYEMLTGRVPFQSASDYELMRAQVEDEPPPPRDFRDEIPPAVELAVMRALAKDPAARFQSATEFRAALISAVPAAALKAEQAEPLIKATRFATTEPQADEPVSETRMPAEPAGFDSNTGTYTLRLPSFLLTAREQFTARFGQLNWKHYGSAAAAMLAVIIGLASLRSGSNQPAPGKNPEPQPTMIQPAPAQSGQIPSAPATIAPLSQETAVRPLDTPAVEEEKPAPAKKPTPAPRARASRSQVATSAQSRPTASPAQNQRQAAPTPTPQQAQKQEPKRKWWEKAAEVGVGVTDAIIRKKRGRP
ncbi:MAG: protein kinase [Blastocatellia bacterium]